MKTLEKNDILSLSHFASLVLSLIVLASCGKHNLDLVEQGASGKSPTLLVTSTIQAGKFSAPPVFELTLSKSLPTSEIMYCVNYGVGNNSSNCCDPLTEGSKVKGANARATAGSSDGKYCLAYIGYTTTETSDITNILFEIDTTAPDIEIETQLRMVQSSQYLDLAYSSEDNGTDGYFFSVLNYNSTQGSDCDVINSESNFASNGLDISGDNTPDTYDLSSEGDLFATSVRGKDLAFYGDNYLYFAIVDSNTSPMRSSCPSIKVVLNDFNIFEFSTNGDSTPNGNGEHEAMGGFQSFGGGSYLGSAGSSKLQVGLLNIIY